MKARRLLPWMAMLVALALVAGCSDDDNPAGPTGGGNGSGAPEFTVTQVSVPEAMKQSQDPFATLSVTYVNLANSFSSWFGFVTPPSSAKLVVPAGAQDGPPWVSTWTQGGMSVTLTIDDAGSIYTWDVVVNGTDGDVVYTNFLLLHAERAKDGNSGTMLIYDPEETGVISDWNWNVATNQVYTFIMNIYGSNEDQQIYVVVNSDQSGQLEFRTNGGGSFSPEFSSSWNAAGAGSWEQFEGGEVVNSGTW